MSGLGDADGRLWCPTCLSTGTRLAIKSTNPPSSLWASRSSSFPTLLSALSSLPRYIDELIEKEVAGGIPSDSIVVGGFSQGGAMALMSLRSKVRAGCDSRVGFAAPAAACCLLLLQGHVHAAHSGCTLWLGARAHSLLLLLLTLTLGSLVGPLNCPCSPDSTSWRASSA